MTVIIAATGALAILGLAVIFGADVVGLLVQRSVYADLDDRTLVQAVGRGHYYADRRMPAVGIPATVLTAVTAAAAFLWGTTLSGILSAAALVLLVTWLLVYARLAKPINTTLTAAALAGEVPADARALQARWESLLPLRVVLNGVTIALLAATLALI
ncbi:DUF1772 domain-containing protein [Microbacterium bovistercoris]|uniref:DUF1772 domain-containing protein n=1 Tax=Microbacterium bovistercoris TaxID=2293570 RepID=A0A371NP62_9MICO|nr:DUF1772 domain-containing protein [Microbacterium bovistercoris]REJ03971.1 DUF1772 domain-containing protein [Microbacterium bovistercoris]